MIRHPHHAGACTPLVARAAARVPLAAAGAHARARLRPARRPLAARGRHKLRGRFRRLPPWPAARRRELLRGAACTRARGGGRPYGRGQVDAGACRPSLGWPYGMHPAAHDATRHVPVPPTPCAMHCAMCAAGARALPADGVHSVLTMAVRPAYCGRCSRSSG